jgi:hypothetical protein
MSISPAQRMPYLSSQREWRLALRRRPRVEAARPGSLVLDVLQKRHHLRMRADRIGDVEQRQAHLRRDVVRADCASVSAAFFSPSHCVAACR